jgi:hypothetical protein
MVRGKDVDLGEALRQHLHLRFEKRLASVAERVFSREENELRWGAQSTILRIRLRTRARSDGGGSGSGEKVRAPASGRITATT